MKHGSFFAGCCLSLLACYGCTDRLAGTGSFGKRCMTGNACGTVFARGEVSSLPAGSRVLLNASGALQASDVVLTYSGVRWEATEDLRWMPDETEAQLTVLYPVYEDLAYTEDNLYGDGQLEDVLYVKDTFPANEDINLQFSHLFSSLIIHLKGILQENFRELVVTCPVTAEQVVAETGEVVLCEKSHQVVFTSASSDGDYALIVPPCKDMAVTASLRTSGKTYSVQLPVRTYAANHEYRYSLRERAAGILTPEDWIAFSQLMLKSKTSYNGKKLSDFGETIDGVTTYYLSADIDFDGVDCTDLEQICKDGQFGDVFDGQGHTISHFTPKYGWGTMGLFATTSTSGVVKNVHLKNSSVTVASNPKCQSGAALLVGCNYGLVANCSVENSYINTCKQDGPTGGLAGYTYGTIVNCYVKDTEIHSGMEGGDKGHCGAVAGYARGNIINCYSVTNTIESESGYSGGFCGRTGVDVSAAIINCYIYDLYVKADKGGLYYGRSYAGSSLNHCLYPTKSPADYALKLFGTETEEENKVHSDLVSYSKDTFVCNTSDSIFVYQCLNEWIDTQASILFPDLTFTRWTSGTGLPAVFSNE